VTSGHDVAWIESDQQRLGLVPSLGGGVAQWRWLSGGQPVDLWRPWSGTSEDRYSLASFAMLPWSNRISHGGFEHGGSWFAMAPNRDGEPYPIHGDGWLQAWALARPQPNVAELRLESRQHGGGPYSYDAVQRFELVDGGLVQSVRVTHRGEAPLPYGLGLHPWFPRTPQTTVRARVGGVWLCGDDPIPTRHTRALPDGWDLNRGAPMNGPLIDNGYDGWDGSARIDWPERGLAVHLTMEPLSTPRGPIAPEYCLVYRPPVGDAFCFEPITQPIDAFHLSGRPGLVPLARGETLMLRVHWRVDTRAPRSNPS
jgi:aldose 1-epimerase